MDEKSENGFLNFLKALLPYVIIVVVVVLIRTFIITPVQVDGTSMYPTLDDKEIMLLKKYDKNFERFDVIVFEYKGARLIKRVIGLPGDKIKYLNGSLYVNNKKVKENFKTNGDTEDFDLSSLDYKVIPEGKYFVMGDNRINSTDSRVIGLISDDMIVGSTSFRLFPFKVFGNISK